MFSIQIKDFNKFKTFTNLVDVEYVDLFLDKENALFICNNTEYFAMIVFPCVCSAGDGPTNLRVKRSLLKTFFSEGNLEVSFSDSKATVTFLDGHAAHTCSVSFGIQHVFSNVYQHKLDLLNRINDYDYFTLGDVDELYKIAKADYSLLNIDAGVAAVYLKNGARVYRPTVYTGSLCLTARSFELLRRCGRSFFAIENFVGVNQDCLTLLVTKTRCSSNAEFQSVVGDSIYKSNLITMVDFTNLTRFVSMKKPKDSYIKIDVATGTCTFTEDTGETYLVSISFSEKRIADGAPQGTINVPVSVVTEILLNMKTAKFLLKRKKSFIELSQDGIYVLFG